MGPRCRSSGLSVSHHLPTGLPGPPAGAASRIGGASTVLAPSPSISSHPPFLWGREVIAHSPADSTSPSSVSERYAPFGDKTRHHDHTLKNLQESLLSIYYPTVPPPSPLVVLCGFSSIISFALLSHCGKIHTINAASEVYLNAQIIALGISVACRGITPHNHLQNVLIFPN